MLQLARMCEIVETVTFKGLAAFKGEHLSMPNECVRAGVRVRARACFMEVEGEGNGQASERVDDL